MTNQNKNPSQLWEEAPNEAHQILNDIVMKLHRMWQQSIHFNPNFESNRLPKAKVRWRSHESADLVEFLWEGEGANEHLVVELDGENSAFLLLANENLIRLLNVWLAISDENGILDENFLTKADKLDFRRHLRNFQNHPSAVRWALIELYNFLFEYEPSLAAIGFDDWGFWHAKQPKFSEINVDNSKFGKLEQFLGDTGLVNAFRNICSGGRYEYSFSGLADYSTASRLSSVWHFEEFRFGTLAEFLVSQPKASTNFLFGETFKALEALLNVEFMTTPYSRDRQIIAVSTFDRYRHTNLAKDMIKIGQNLASLRFRISEERRALLARKFEGQRKSRTVKAVQANQLDKLRREKAILTAVATLQLTDYLTRSSKRLNFSKLARDVTKLAPFRSTKSGMGTRAIARFLRDAESRLVFRP